MKNKSGGIIVVESKPELITKPIKIGLRNDQLLVPRPTKRR
jgi:hypothetical protein